MRIGGLKIEMQIGGPGKRGGGKASEGVRPWCGLKENCVRCQVDYR
jgi:hypothetical protein